ncbi:MAG: response regulator [Pseudomonadota bacterium]
MGNPAAGQKKLLDRERFLQITRQLYDSEHFAYLLVDHQWQVLEVSDNLVDYGFPLLVPGLLATDMVDFLVGLDATEAITLPFINSPDGKPIRVRLLPEAANTIVMVSDATEEFLGQQMLQQKANENQLLLETQDKLMRELKEAKALLEEKNSQLEEAARLQSSFISGLSHEFRTPLSSIIGYSNLLIAQPSLDADTLNNNLEVVQRSGKHLLSLVENLLDHGKYNSSEITLNPKSVNLVALFNEIAMMVAPLAAAKEIEFKSRSELDGDLTVFLDDSRLRQCLINLLGNAIKFTDIGMVSLAASWEDDQLTVKIKDTGPGISSEHLQQITKPFWQAPGTGKAGTGLGLTITEQIIELMGGSMSIDSQLEKGTEISFAITASRVEAELETNGGPVTDIDDGMRLLFAEDDEDIAALTCLLLEEQGVAVTHVGNGEQALAELNSQAFDLVLMDLHMPVMDGFTAAKKIRDDGNTIPLIIMSASSNSADQARAQQLGCDGYLVKPVDIQDLLAMGQQFLLNRGTEK